MPYFKSKEKRNNKSFWKGGFWRMIQIKNKKKKRENILKKYPDAIIADVTSRAEDDLIKLSPFYPHDGILNTALN